MTRPNWHTSTFTDGATNCVEVREHGHGADVRDTQHRECRYLSFPTPEWAAFSADVRIERL
jgi:hypothetical protein